MHRVAFEISFSFLLSITLLESFIAELYSVLWKWSFKNRSCHFHLQMVLSHYTEAKVCTLGLHGLPIGPGCCLVCCSPALRLTHWPLTLLKPTQLVSLCCSPWITSPTSPCPTGPCLSVTSEGPSWTFLYKCCYPPHFPLISFLELIIPTNNFLSSFT